jgi:addiction module RelE/StbE family toxin
VRVRWDPKALVRLEAVGDYIAQDSPSAAARVVLGIMDAVDDLAAHPLRGRPGRVAGTRELVIPRTPYIVAYRVRGQVVEDLAVQHSAQQWPESLD